MRHVNVVYDGDYENVSIICVPDHVAENIEAVTQAFFDWIRAHPSVFTKTMGGRNVIVAGVDEYVWWLNQYVVSVPEHASIIGRCVAYNPDLPTADF